MNKEYAIKMMALLQMRYNSGTIIYPEYKQIFRAFNETPYDKTRVVILGQDPYYNGQADGLAFSCKNEISPSLSKIYGALGGFEMRTKTSLEHWAAQGVLLVNSVLTVAEGVSGSHKGIGWEIFTTTLLADLAKNKNVLVWLIWGKEAQKLYQERIEPFVKTDNLVIMSEHPAFASYKRKRWDNGDCFNKTNEYLKDYKIEPINW